MIGTLGFAFLAGILSTLSPCVLPLVPIVLAGAASEHRLGPLALTIGLALSFAGIGLFVATVGFAIGLDGEIVRGLGAILLTGIGIVLAVPGFQARITAAAGPVGARAQQLFGGMSTAGFRGQFALGLLLGLVWGPCVGPTLGAASLLAARGERLGEVVVTMAVFGLGAALPLLLLGLVSREALLAWRGRLMAGGRALKTAMGLCLAVLGLLILSGLDKRVEALAVAASPDWLTTLTTRY